MRGLPAFLLGLCLLCCAPARAHAPSDSFLTLTAQQEGFAGRWDIALRDLDYALGLDRDHDGQLTLDEVQARQDAIAQYALSRLRVRSEAGPCMLRVDGQSIERHGDSAYSALQLQGLCPAPPRALQFDYRLFAELDAQHRGLLTLRTPGQTLTAVLGATQPLASMALSSQSAWEQQISFVQHGVEHIFKGADHLLFLFALLLPAVLVRPQGAHASELRAATMDIVKVVSAFTLSHSITLGLAATGVLLPPTAWVEAAIAASVILGALNNLRPAWHGRRVWMAFGFGLIHGFGFANVLQELHLPETNLIACLLSFNLGVELGQLCVVALCMPIAYALRHARLYLQLVRFGSASIALAGAFWLLERSGIML